MTVLIVGEGREDRRQLNWYGFVFPLSLKGQTVRYIHSPTELSLPGPRREQTVRYIHSPTELSLPGPRREQTVRYIHSPTELSLPGLRGEQTVRYIHSPTELSLPGPRGEQTVRYIHSAMKLSMTVTIIIQFFSPLADTLPVRRISLVPPVTGPDVRLISVICRLEAFSVNDRRDYMSQEEMRQSKVLRWRWSEADVGSGGGGGNVEVG